METNLYPLTDFSPHKERMILRNATYMDAMEESRLLMNPNSQSKKFLSMRNSLMVNQSRRPTNRSLVRKDQK